MATCSVVILTANRRALLETVLGALEAGARVPDEVVVVNNQSQDDTVAFLASATFAFRLVVVEGPGATFAESRNAGVRAATGDLIAFIDDDCEVDRQWLKLLVEEMEKNGWEAAGGSAIPADELEAPNGYAPELAWATGCTTPGFFTPLAGRLHLPTTSNLIARRELWRDIPFRIVQRIDAHGRWSYASSREDAQWWCLVRRQGRSCGVVPRAIVWHHIPASRLDLDVIRERIEMDGEAHWIREKPRAEVRAAARDVIFAGVSAARESFTRQEPVRQTWEKNLGWARRQLAFLRTAVDDVNEGLHPTTRLNAYAIESARALFAAGKAAARTGLRAAYTSARNVPRIPTIDAPPARLLVVLHGFLGDAVLALPMLGQLAAALRETSITVLTGPVAGPLLKANVPGNITITITPRSARGRGPTSAANLWRLVKQLRPDAVLIAYCHGLHPAPFFFLDGVPVISWREDNGLQQRVWGDMVSAPVEKNFRKCEVAALLDLLAPLRIRTRLERPRVTASGRARERIASILRAAKTSARQYAVVHLEPANRAKHWDADRFASVLNLFEAKGLSVFFVGSRAGRVEVERHGLAGPGRQSLHGLLDSDELAGLLEGAAVFVGCDSGPAHVAQGVDCASCLLFGATEVHRWGPLADAWAAESASALSRNVVGAGRFRVVSAAPGDWLSEELAGMPENHPMRLLEAERVVAEVVQILDGPGKAPFRAESR